MTLTTVHELTPFEDVLDALEHLARTHALAWRLEVGRVLLDAFFAGDTAAYHSRDPRKETRFTHFFATCRDDLDKLGIGETTARNCIKARLVYDTLPVELQSALFFSQVVELTRVADPSLRVQLAVAAVQGNWTVRQLRDSVGVVLAGGEVESLGIAPPTVEVEAARAPHAGRMVTAAEKWTAQFDTWADRWAKIDDTKIRSPQRKRLREALAQARKRLAALEATLAE